MQTSLNECYFSHSTLVYPNFWIGSKHQIPFFFVGGLAVGVPGELKGMEAAWKKYGKLPWKKLFEPAISLAEKGVNVSKSLAIALRVWEFQVLKDKSLK